MRCLIGFSTSDSLISRVIRWFTKATVSHTYIVFDYIPQADHELYEAVGHGFHLSTRDKLTRGSTRIIKEVPVDLNVPLAFAVCRKWLETPYDFSGLFGEAWVQVGKLFGQRWPNPWANAHSMFCSEAATFLMQIAAPNGPLRLVIRNLDARQTDPEMLLRVLTGIPTTVAGGGIFPPDSPETLVVTPPFPPEVKR
jgi:hypothetical protein